MFSSQSGGVIVRLGGTTGGVSYLGLAFLIIAPVIALAARRAGGRHLRGWGEGGVTDSPG